MYVSQFGIGRMRCLKKNNFYQCNGSGYPKGLSMLLRLEKLYNHLSTFILVPKLNVAFLCTTVLLIFLCLGF